ncbi:hypothetical protein JCM1840_002913 [Sporobolomyces johnsonii]
MHRFSSPLLVLALIALIPSPSSALPLVADPAINIDFTAGSWKQPLSGGAPPSLARRDLGTAEIVVLLNGTVEVHTYVNTQDSDGEEEAVFNPAGRTGSKTKVAKNPKVVLNPKNPDYSSSVAAQTRTSTAATQSPTATSSSSTDDNFAADPTSTTPSSSSTPSPTPSTTIAASSTTTTTSSAATATYTGQATFFYQNGVAGACGNVNSDETPIVALDSRLYGNTNAVSKYCGKSLTITNTANNQSVIATVADACPTCASKYSLDLSTGAFDQIGEEVTGVLEVVWWWNEE